MKRLIALIAAGFMGLSIAGCSDSDECYGTATECIGGYGYTCSDASSCYYTREACESSGSCN